MEIWFQRLEGAIIFAGALWWFLEIDGSLWWFFALILTIDVFMIGYLHNKRTGAFVYNVGHNFASPVILLALAWSLENQTAMQFALIWAAHIGMDRASGYGLKTLKSFHHTHLGIKAPKGKIVE